MILALLLSTSIFADGLYADGFRPSNWAEAINHVGDRIRSSHSGGNGKITIIGLDDMTPEQRDRLYMVQINDQARMEHDSRRETLALWEDFQEELAMADFSNSRKQEIEKRVNSEIVDYKRHIEGGFYRYRSEKIDQCLNDCSHMSEEKSIACYKTEIDKRIECESKILINPSRHYCNYQTKKESDKCREEAGWDYQVCQSKCF